MAVFRYTVCADNYELVLRGRINCYCQSTKDPTLQYLVIEKRNSIYRKKRYPSNNISIWKTNRMETSKECKPKCEKSLPFRKRLHHRLCKETKSFDDSEQIKTELSAESSINERTAFSSLRQDSSSSSSTTVQEIVHQSLESSSSGSNIQDDFQNLRLLAEVTRDDGVPDPEETSDIPLTIESLPSTSTSNPKKSPFLCSFCSKKFHHKGDMNKHMRCHTKEQPYKCTYCSSKFSHTSNLQRHLRIHTGCKPYTCEYCNRTFSRIDKLHLHQKNGVCRKNKED
ncbi:zinc finger protein 235-like [Harmonia axyridis]|uniref:zinc finger protein 235-like n=1 Tax=Harmonia axyridis TaxID=115357 RepID=UPI001E278978|nr:zinc finger protein 235-like [Harmonia axyridis]